MRKFLLQRCGLLADGKIEFRRVELGYDLPGFD